MASQTKVEFDARLEALERRVAAMEKRLDPDDEADRKLVDQAWREQAGNPVTRWDDAKRELGVD